MSEHGPVIIIIFQLIFLEGVLSIDNAAVIGALVSPLPDNEPVVWPTSLQGIGNWLHPVLGNQRLAALRVGLLGAYTGRGFTAGIFAGWAFGLTDTLDLRVGLGAQYIRFSVDTAAGELSTSTPFIAIDAVLGYRL